MDKIILLALIFSLASCGGSGGGNAEAPQPNPAPIAVVSLSGHAVKGPLANALFSAFEFNNTSASLIGAEPFAQASSDAQSRISNLEVSATIATPFIIEVSADVATDLSTNALPILTTLRTVVTQDMLESSQAIFPNPLTTIALEVARINADSNNGMFIGNNDSEISADEFTAALPIATKIVAQALGFGIPAQTNLFSEPPLVTASTATIQQLGRVAIYRTAIETTTALILELQQAAGPNPPTADALLMGLASDLADGRIDGVYNGNSIEVFSNIVDIAAVLSIDQSLLLIPGTLVPVLDVKLEVAAETELTGFSEVDITALTNGEIEVPPGSINLEPDSDLDGTLDVIDTAIDNPCIPEVFVSACAQDSDGDGTTDFSEGEFSNGDGDAAPDYLESSIIDADSDGFSNQVDSNNTDACLPGAFNASCSQDTDGDGTSDFNEGETTDTDGDGNLDYVESSATDTDGDGLSDQADSSNTNACLPSAFNANCAQDTDGDGTSDFNEGETTDTDGDGAFDYQESSVTDTDSDGLSDQADSNNTDVCLPSAFNANCAQDSDGDGTTDFAEGETTDTDGDGIFDYQESSLTDADSDGVNDQADSNNTDACLPSAFNASCTQDSDGDGASDFNEGETTDTDGDGAFDYQESSVTDTDSDGLSDQADSNNTDVCLPSAFNANCAQDTDGDGTSDFNEGETTDTDGDGAFDYQESSVTDTDSDGLSDQADSNNTDACLPGAFNASCSQDTDGDGTSDFNEGETTDTDGDGALDYQESSLTDADSDGVNDQADSNNTDACLPSVFNASCAQDTDGDGTTDFAEGETTDTDGDGTLDYHESSITDIDSDGLSDQADSNNTDACLPSAFNASCTQDTDGDGVSDFNEGETTDTDGDGIFDYQESSLTDADSDGVNDQADSNNTDACLPSAFNASCTQDSDGDGASDFNEGETTDTDGDGIFDYQESSVTDTDSDGVNDQADSNNTDACLPSVFNASCAQDTDGDGTSDFNEGETTDTDGDGIFDYQESSLTDADSDGVNDQADSSNTDACLPSAFNASCAQDTDGDGTSDFAEGETADTDGDGVLDYLESWENDADIDGVVDQFDTADQNACFPDPFSANCNPGMPVRPANLSCIAPELGTTQTGDIVLQRKFPNETFSLPVKALQAPNDNTYWYVVQQGGDIIRVQNSESENTPENYFSIDISWNPNTETGLLSMAFSPNWPSQKEFYIFYATTSLKSRLSRIKVIDDSSLPVVYEEEIILDIDQPFNNHNGGDIAFGTDGFLYLGLGDGGSGDDPFGNSQDTTTLLGSMLRIDVHNVVFPSPGYNIPPGNLYSANEKCGNADNLLSCPEIYAWGLRNPWRWSFDTLDQSIWLGDVGQGMREEVNLISLGGNYGWDCREGSVAGPTVSCPATGLIEPIHDYPHFSGNSSITGGYVYRGANIPSLAGKYLFADYLSGRIWTLSNTGGDSYTSSELMDTSHFISSFAQDNAGELYILSHQAGEFYKIVGEGEVVDDSNIPLQLSDTGCVQGLDPTQPAEGLIPYQPNARFWSDGADKLRWIALPDGTSIDPQNSVTWDYPAGTVAVKNFLVEQKLIETRLFMKHPNGVWAGYTYEWDDTETSATRVVGGKTRTLLLSQGSQDWIYPSEDECILCHTAAAGFVLGLNTPQLNSDFEYPATGVTDNQLETLNHIDLFTNDVAEPVAILPSIVDPENTAEDINYRAKAYLHTNCASCHQPGGGAPVSMDLRYQTPLGAMNVCNVTPQLSNLGILDAKLIAPGDPASSIILNRMNRRDNEAMPPIGSALVDSDGIALLTQWVNQLACN